MLEIILNGGGLIVGVIGLVMAALTHPAIQDRIRLRPNSILAAADRLMFRRPRRLGDIPRELTIADIIFNDTYRAEISGLLTRLDSRWTIDDLKLRLRDRVEYRLVIEEAARHKIVQYAFTHHTFLASVICEFGNHFLFLRKSAEYEDVTLPLRDGFFVKISKSGPTISIKDIEKLDVEVDPNPYWKSCCDSYFLAYNLPFRTIDDPAELELLDELDLQAIHSAMRQMFDNFCLYVAVSRSGGRLSEKSVDTLRSLLAKAEKEMRSIERTISKYAHEQVWLERGKFLTSCEVLLSIVHKGIIGALSLGDRVVVDASLASSLAQFWSIGARRLKKPPPSPQILADIEKWPADPSGG